LTTQLKLMLVLVLLLTLISRLVVLNRNGGLPKFLLMFMLALVLCKTSLVNTFNLPLMQQQNAGLEPRLPVPTANPLAYLLAIHCLPETTFIIKRVTGVTLLVDVL
jgi:hypothetical protein